MNIVFIYMLASAFASVVIGISVMVIMIMIVVEKLKEYKKRIPQ